MTEHKQHIYITTTTYSFLTLLSFFTVFLAYIFMFLTYSKTLPLGITDIFLVILISLYLYFRFQFIICPVVISIFFAEKLITNLSANKRISGFNNLFSKYQFLILAIIFVFFLKIPIAFLLFICLILILTFSIGKIKSNIDSPIKNRFSKYQFWIFGITMLLSLIINGIIIYIKPDLLSGID